MTSTTFGDSVPVFSERFRLNRLRPTNSMKTILIASATTPKGVKLKKPSGGLTPRSRKAFWTMMFGEDAIRVIIPLIITATQSGMSIRLRLNPVLLAIVRQRGSAWRRSPRS